MNKLSFNDLKDKVCVITGGGGVIGKTLSEGLASVGVRMAITDISKELADNVSRCIAKEYNVESISVEADVLDRGSLLKVKDKINREMGKIDILINCAGGNSPKATTEIEFIDKDTIDDLGKTFFGLDIDGFRKVFDLNFLGTILSTMVFAQDMIERRSGVILNVSSMNAFRPLTKIPAYSAAKASVNNFTEWLAVHLAKINIRVNAIAPGFFLTNQNKFLLIDEKTGNLTPRGNMILNSTPMGKFGAPEDLQGTVLYLLSDLSRFVTGVVIPIDGGFNAYAGV
jgi:NAD(P)-dependent dehydrogenase (short-subunit alcohol dehydrogenase family)